MAKKKTVKQKAVSRNKVGFAFTAPDAQTVQLAGDFTDWQKAPLSLQKGTSGVWKISVALASGRYEYRFLVDGQWQDDPACTERCPNSFGSENCVLVVTGV